jgi:hypothetical protein
VPEAVRERMLAWRDAGWSLARIADQLNRDGVDTPTGRAGWYAQGVRQVVEAERRRRFGGEPGQLAAGPVVELRLRACGLDSRCFPDLAKAICFMVQAAGGDLMEITLIDPETVEGSTPDQLS